MTIGTHFCKIHGSYRETITQCEDCAQEAALGFSALQDIANRHFKALQKANLELVVEREKSELLTQKLKTAKIYLKETFNTVILAVPEVLEALKQDKDPKIQEFINELLNTQPSAPTTDKNSS